MTQNKRITRSLFRSFLLAIVCIAVASCSSQRSHTGADTATEATTPSRQEAPQVSQLAGAYNEWSTFYAPFSVRLSRPVSFNFSGRATMVYDKAVSLSLRMLGMEVGVVYIDKDSAIVVDKFHKYYVSAPISSVTARTAITLSDIQSILLGQAIYPGKGPLSRIKNVDELFSSAKEGDNLLLTPRRSPKGATWYLTLGPGPVLRRLTVEPDGMQPFNAVFSDIVSSVAGSVASEISITGMVSKKEINADIEWKMNSAEWNSARTVSKPNLRGYKQLTLSDLIKAAGK